jgi:hypothetical protein
VTSSCARVADVVSVNKEEAIEHLACRAGFEGVSTFPGDGIRESRLTAKSGGEDSRKRKVERFACEMRYVVVGTFARTPPLGVKSGKGRDTVLG